MKLKKVVLFLSVLLLEIGCSNKKSIKIGFIGPLTGDNSDYGILCKNAVHLAYDDFKVNHEDLFSQYDISIVAEDSECNSEKGVADIEKLININKISLLLGPVVTGVAFVVAPRVQASNIVMITPSATHKDITSIGDCIFRTVVSDGLQGKIAGLYFYHQLKYRKLGALYIQNDYSKGLYNGMKESFEKSGGKVVISEDCVAGEKDYRTQLTRLKSSDIEAIYIPNYVTEIAQILEQANQLGITIPFLSGDGIANDEIIKLAGDYVDGIYYIAPPQSKISDKFRVFSEKYEKRFKRIPEAFASNSYNAAMIVLECIYSLFKEGKEITRSAIKEKMANVRDFEGLNGLINFEPNGDLVGNQGVYKFEGKTPVYLGEFYSKNDKLIKVE